eukprot:CAMPEP_0171665642 /NCGR_PEP_ID=MMETSP0990-20121206/47592_1 /TAXON_ID=483369 /ORGANISM="non described non described, Strain CCMP2098" /LENGTH=114 /DNA_ID=CAMNT_0012248933 /DNA_START=15 /DNA_END=359 /DNA_ORIENTATION=-
MSFLNRVLSYLGTDMLAKKLAENRAFQWFALNSVESVQFERRTAENRAFQWFALNSVESVQKFQKDGVQAALKGAPRPDPAVTQKIESGKKAASSFGNALWNEIKKDLGMTKKS